MIHSYINNFSIYILILSFLFLILSIIIEFGGGTGWTLYPPLSTSYISLSSSSIIYIIFTLLISGLSSYLTSINFLITFILIKLYSLILNIIILYSWSLFITSIILILILPILSGTLILIFSDIYSNTIFYDSISYSYILLIMGYLIEILIKIFPGL
jgi:cytochrome c oxidase subunit 1